MTTILIVDGSDRDRRALRPILVAAGYRVFEASDVPGGLGLYAATRPALLIVDTLLARASRPPLLDRLRQIDPAACILLSTADLHCAVQESIEGAGACGLVFKPFVPGQVLEAIEAALRESAPL